MKKLLVLLLLVLEVSAFAAMTCTETSLGHKADVGTVKHGRLFTCAWTSDGSGNASATVALKGFLVRLDTDPGSTAPTDDYDVTMPCSLTGSADSLAGIALNRDTANSEFLPTAGAGISVLGYFNDTCTVTVANAGNAKVGTIYLHVVNP